MGQKVLPPLTPLCFYSYAGRVVDSTFEAKRQNPEVSVRNIDPVLKGLRLRLEQLTHVSPPDCLHIQQQQMFILLSCQWSKTSPSCPTTPMYETYMSHMDFHGLLTFHFDLLSDQTSMECFLEADSHYFLATRWPFLEHLPQPQFTVLTGNLMCREMKLIGFILHSQRHLSFFDPNWCIDSTKQITQTLRLISFNLFQRCLKLCQCVKAKCKDNPSCCSFVHPFFFALGASVMMSAGIPDGPLHSSVFHPLLRFSKGIPRLGERLCKSPPVSLRWTPGFPPSWMWLEELQMGDAY